jgi:hypothetical protein
MRTVPIQRRMKCDDVKGIEGGGNVVERRKTCWE